MQDTSARLGPGLPGHPLTQFAQSSSYMESKFGHTLASYPGVPRPGNEARLYMYMYMLKKRKTAAAYKCSAYDRDDNA